MLLPDFADDVPFSSFSMFEREAYISAMRDTYAGNLLALQVSMHRLAFSIMKELRR